MLASITPLGEGSRGFSWSLTASAFTVGAVGGGTLAGLAGGAIGSALPDGDWRTAAALVVLVAAALIDATGLVRRLPSTRRQVNEDWMTRYRGWVYGLAFGAQLGVGMATVVTTAAIYAVALGTLLAGSPGAGALIGACFGAARAVSLLPARHARDTAGLVRVQLMVSRLSLPARRAIVLAELAAAAVLAGALA